MQYICTYNFLRTVDENKDLNPFWLCSPRTSILAPDQGVGSNTYLRGRFTDSGVRSDPLIWKDIRCRGWNMVMSRNS